MSNSTRPSNGPSQPPARKPRKKAGMMDVITGQKLLIYGMIGHLCGLPILVGAIAFLGGTTDKPEVNGLFFAVLALGLLMMFAAGIVGALAILRIGVVLFPESRYVYAIGAILPAPLIGLIVMFTANSRATKYLKERGVKVGFFGAKR